MRILFVLLTLGGVAWKRNRTRICFLLERNSELLRVLISTFCHYSKALLWGNEAGQEGELLLLPVLGTRGAGHSFVYEMYRWKGLKDTAWCNAGKPAVPPFEGREAPPWKVM